jgi:hypothetical protein
VIESKDSANIIKFINNLKEEEEEELEKKEISKKKPKSKPKSKPKKSKPKKACLEIGTDQKNGTYLTIKSNLDPKMGNVPIKLNPCNNFKLHKKSKEERVEYFKNHLAECNQCELIDNNRIQVKIYFDTAVFKIRKITKPTNKSKKLSNIINCYESVSQYNVLNDTKNTQHILFDQPYIEILRVCNDDLYQEGSIYIVFITQPGIYIDESDQIDELDELDETD